MANRNTGMFIDLVDASGKIQVFSHKENLSEEDMKTLRERWKEWKVISSIERKSGTPTSRRKQLYDYGLRKEAIIMSKE